MDSLEVRQFCEMIRNYLFDPRPIPLYIKYCKGCGKISQHIMNKQTLLCLECSKTMKQ